MKKQTWKAAVSAAAIAATAAIPMAANAAYTRVTQTIDGIDWQLQLDPETGSATLGYGGSFNESAYACPDVPLNAANIPWTFIGDDGIRYTVTKIAQAAFSRHEKLIGVLTIPDSVTTIERNAFAEIHRGEIVPELHGNRLRHVECLADKIFSAEVAAEVHHADIEQVVAPAEISQVDEIALLAHKDGIAIL